MEKSIGMYSPFLAVFFSTRSIKIAYGFKQLLRKFIRSDSTKTMKTKNYEYEFLFVIVFQSQTWCDTTHQWTNKNWYHKGLKLVNDKSILVWMYSSFFMSCLFWVCITTSTYRFGRSGFKYEMSDSAVTMKKSYMYKVWFYMRYDCKYGVTKNTNWRTELCYKTLVEFLIISQKKNGFSVVLANLFQTRCRTSYNSFERLGRK